MVGLLCVPPVYATALVQVIISSFYCALVSIAITNISTFFNHYSSGRDQGVYSTKEPPIKKEIFFFINYSAGFSLGEVPNMAKGKGKKLSIDINSDQFPTKVAEVYNLLAELCTETPSEVVKFCLSIYEYGKPIRQIEHELERESRAALDETAKFLKTPNYLDKTKGPLAHLIVCCFQNLLPDNCSICHEQYKINLAESPLLECAICDQAVHRMCFIELAAATA